MFRMVYGQFIKVFIECFLWLLASLYNVCYGLWSVYSNVDRVCLIVDGQIVRVFIEGFVWYLVIVCMCLECLWFMASLVECS